MAQDQLPENVERVRIWDPALRLFHWALVGTVVTAWILGQWGPNIMTLHFILGYVVIGLLAFRLIWGLFGPKTARFTQFIYGPRAILGYLRNMGKRTPSYWPGHNPVGALSTFAILAVLVFQVATGLISDPDDFVNVGPLAGAVGSETAGKAVLWHYWGSIAVLAIVALHVASIVFYAVWKRENLVRPMITGWKLVHRDRDT